MRITCCWRGGSWMRWRSRRRRNDKYNNNSCCLPSLLVEVMRFVTKDWFGVLLLWNGSCLSGTFTQVNPFVPKDASYVDLSKKQPTNLHLISRNVSSHWKTDWKDDLSRVRRWQRVDRAARSCFVQAVMAHPDINSRREVLLHHGHLIPYI